MHKSTMSLVLTALFATLATGCDVPKYDLQTSPKVDAQTATPVTKNDIWDQITCTVNDDVAWNHIGHELLLSERQVDAETGDAVYDVSERGQHVMTVELADVICVKTQVTTDELAKANDEAEAKADAAS